MSEKMPINKMHIEDLLAINMRREGEENDERQEEFENNGK